MKLSAMEFLRRAKTEPPARRQSNLMSGQDSYTFRRSRTLTGSVSSDVRSVAEGHSNLQSPRLKLHQLRRHQRMVTAAFIVSFIVVMGLGWMVGQFVRMPDTLQYSQQLNEQPNSDQYRRAIETYFAQYPTERFLFQLESHRLNSAVTSAHPEVKNVAIGSSMPGMFTIEVQFRRPVLSWFSSGRQLYIDSEGVAFHKNYFTEPAVAVEDQSGIQIDNTNVVASGRFIAFLGRIVSSVDNAGMKVQKIIIPAGTAREVDIQLEGRNYPIKTHIDREPALQAQDVVNAVHYLDSRNIIPEYLDTRVAGKAYYR